MPPPPVVMSVLGGIPKSRRYGHEDKPRARPSIVIDSADNPAGLEHDLPSTRPGRSPTAKHMLGLAMQFGAAGTAPGSTQDSAVERVLAKVHGNQQMVCHKTAYKTQTTQHYVKEIYTCDRNRVFRHPRSSRCWLVWHVKPRQFMGRGCVDAVYSVSLRLPLQSSGSLPPDYGPY